MVLMGWGNGDRGFEEVMLLAESWECLHFSNFPWCMGYGLSHLRA